MAAASDTVMADPRAPLRWLVVGATGATGREVVRQALGRGHEVTALVRDVSRITARDRLRVVSGDALDAKAIDAVMPGHDVVVFVLGTRSRIKEVLLYSSAIRVVLDAMQRHGVTRLVAVSAGGVGGTRNVAVPWLFRAVVIPLLAGSEYDDMARMESLIAASEAGWTVLRPLWLRNGPALGGVRLGDAPFAPRRWGIRRADLASAIIDVAEQGLWCRSAVWVGY